MLLYAGCSEAPVQRISGYRDTFMSLYMPPSALTGRAKGMDSLSGLSLPSLSMLPPGAAPGNHASTCGIGRDGHWKSMVNKI